MAEKIYKRDDGSQIMIVTNKSSFDFNKYTIRILTRIPPKRTWNEIKPDQHTYSRVLRDTKAKEKYRLDTILSCVTLEEIHEVQMMCWNEFKPNFDNILNEILL
jgi:hypothetical protein